MFEKGSRFYADWRDKRGTRHRRAFPTAEEAPAYEAEQKAAPPPKTQRSGPQVAALVRAYLQAWPTTGKGEDRHQHPMQHVGAALIAEAGSKAPQDLNLSTSGNPNPSGTANPTKYSQSAACASGLQTEPPSNPATRPSTAAPDGKSVAPATPTRAWCGSSTSSEP